MVDEFLTVNGYRSTPSTTARGFVTRRGGSLAAGKGRSSAV
jgi:hypothetical protein